MLDSDKLKAFAGDYMANKTESYINNYKKGTIINEYGPNEGINGTEKNNPVEVLNNYESADKLLTSNVDKQTVSSYLANAKVSLWDRIKLIFPWLWFMICNWTGVSLGDYTRAVKYYRDKQNQSQNNNKGTVSLIDEIQDAVDKNSHEQLKPKFENTPEREQS